MSDVRKVPSQYRRPPCWNSTPNWSDGRGRTPLKQALPLPLTAWQLQLVSRGRRRQGRGSTKEEGGNDVRRRGSSGDAAGFDCRCATAVARFRWSSNRWRREASGFNINEVRRSQIWRRRCKRLGAAMFGVHGVGCKPIWFCGSCPRVVYL